MRTTFRPLLTVLSLALLVMSVITASAQTVRGTITGLIADPSGAVVSGATVVLTAPATGVSVTTTSNNSGVYRFDGVLVGDYVLKVTANGFTTATAHAIVTVGALVGRDFTLKIGDATTITVSDTPPDLQTDEAVHSTVLPQESLAILPISGQNSLNLMLTAPGVAASKTGVGGSDGGIGAVNGARPRSNNFLLDGINNNDISVMGPQFTFTNNDALQEVSVQTSNFSSQYGRAGGAVIIQVTKSGTERFHGTAANVYRSHAFYATNNLQRVNKTSVPKFVENIPAFTFGGPLIIPHLYHGQKKTFFFGAAQWDHYSSGGSQNTFTVPTEAGYQTLASLKNACPNVASYLTWLGSARGPSGSATQSTIPIDVPANLASTTCNGSARTGMSIETSSFLRSVPELSLDNNHLFRIDHVINQKQNVMVRWMYDSNSDNVGGTIGQTPDFDVPYKARYMAGNMNYNYAITNQVANEFRFGFSRNNVFWNMPNNSAATAPIINIENLTALQLSNNFPQGRISNTWQFEDDVTWVKGHHAIKIGAQVLRQLAVQQAPYNSRGSVTYASTPASSIIASNVTSLANFIDNFGGSAGASTISFGSGRYHPNLLTLSFFAQDTYKVSQDLTINYGVRYENFGQPANGFKYPSYVGPSADITDTTRVDTAKTNFGPSVGINWAPDFLSAKHDTVIRAGYSITFDTFYNNMLSNMAAGGPNTQSSQPIVSTSNTTTPRGYVGMSSVLASLTPVPLNPYQNFISQFKKHMRNPYYHHMALSVQKTLPGGVLLDVSYVGSMGRELFFTDNVNPALPNSTYTGTATQSTAYGSATLRYYANRGLIQPRESGLNSSYNSLQIAARRRELRTALGSFFISGNYTWSKNLDSLSDIFATYSSGAAPSKAIVQYGSPQLWDWGPSDNDRRHISNMNVAWNIKGSKQNRAMEIATSGWSLIPVVYAYSGNPLTIFNGTDRDLDGLLSNDRPNIGNATAPRNTRAVRTSTTNCGTGYYDPNKVTGGLINTGCVDPSTVRFVQAGIYDPVNPKMVRRNSIYSGRYVDMDLSVLKNFRIAEGTKFELRAEFFNFTNTQSWDTGNTGTATITSSSNRFLDWSLKSGGNRTFRVAGKFSF